MKQWTWKDFLGISWLWLGISFMWTAILAVLLPKLVEQFAGVESRGTALAWIGGTGAAISAVVQIIVGYKSDRLSSRFGRRIPFLAVGGVLAIIPLVWFAVVDSLWGLAGAFFLLQVFINIANGPYQAVIPDLVPEQKHGEASLWMGLMQHLGQATGPIAAGFLLSQASGQKSLFGIISVTLFVCLLLTLFKINTFPKTIIKQKGLNSSLNIKDMFSLNLNKYPYFKRLLISRLIINLGFYTVVDFMLYYVHYSLNAENYEQQTGILMACMVLAGLFGAVPMGKLSDKYPKVKLIMATNSLTIISAIAFVLSREIDHARIAGLILGFSFGAFTVVDWALACVLLPKEESARYMGIWNLTAVLPQILAPVLLGPLTDIISKNFDSGSAYRFAMALVGVYIAVGTFSLKGLKEPKLS